MIKLDIVNQVADKTGVPKQKAEQVVDSLFNAMKDALAKGKRIELRGFGVFIVKPANAESDVILERAKKFRFPPEKQFASNPERICRQRKFNK